MYSRIRNPNGNGSVGKRYILFIVLAWAHFTGGIRRIPYQYDQKKNLLLNEREAVNARDISAYNLIVFETYA